MLDGCVISGNSATENGGGIWNENYGNNLVTVVNGTVANNTAAQGGALYISENEAEVGSGGGKTFLILSTLSGNAPAVKEYGAERLSTFRCTLHGEDRGEAMPSEANQYCYVTESKHTGDHVYGGNLTLKFTESYDGYTNTVEFTKYETVNAFSADIQSIVTASGINSYTPTAG